MLTTKELSQQIKKDLKAAGYKVRDIGVKVCNAGYDTAVNCVVKSPKVSCQAIEKIVNKYEEIDRDERTGEILQGCNVYVVVNYDYGLFDEVAQEFQELASQALASSQEVTEILPGLFLIYFQGSHTVRQEGQYSSYSVSDAKELASFMYKFKEFGNFAA